MTRRQFIAASSAATAAVVMPRDVAGAPVREVPVLMYHDISEDFSDAYTISPSRFAAQMEWLYSNGYKALSVGEMAGGYSLPERAVVLTFDDGYASFMDYAFHLMTEYGFKATINAVGAYAGGYMRFGGNRPVLSWDEYRYLQRSGLVEVGCHTFDLHKRRGIKRYSKSAVAGDLERFVDVYEQELGRSPEVLAWPFGSYDALAIRIAKKAGFKYLLNSDEKRYRSGGPLDRIPRLNINDRLDLVSFSQYIGGIW